MAKRKHRRVTTVTKPVRALIDPVINIGEYLRLPDRTNTRIRICALDATTTITSCSEEFSRVLYTDLIPDRGLLTVSCAMPTNPPHTITTQHYWLQPKGDTPDASGLMGPFDRNCLLNQAILLEGENGETHPMLVYLVDVIHETRKWLIKNGYYSRDTPTQESVWEGENLF